VHPDADQDGIDDDTGERCTLPFTDTEADIAREARNQDILTLLSLAGLVMLAVGGGLLVSTRKTRIQ
jgi:hypothetical protein